MTSGYIEELALPFDTSRAEQLLAGRRRRMRSRLVSLGITVLILVALYLWQRDRLSVGAFLGLYGVVLGISVVWLLVHVVGFLRARRGLASIGSGVALRIGRTGVEMRGVYVPWPEVVSLAAVKGRIGQGPLLQLSRTSGPRLTVPFDQLDARPATLDTTARAYSAGKHGVDLEAFEN